MKASVVINTYNRANLLADCIEALLRQTYSAMEIIVVNGPSTDQTPEILSRFEERIVQGNCAARNLSISRNIGIELASGDIVAFIDDDAVAHSRWVERIVAGYTDPGVGAVGGFTLDHTGRAFQAKYTFSDRLGDSLIVETQAAGELLSASGHMYPSLLGTNSSFRRSALTKIGGFDPVFEYFLDETDVCLRIFDLGMSIRTVEDAIVLHRYAPSHIRDARRIPKTFLAPMRSRTYFSYRHNKLATTEEIDQYLQSNANTLRSSILWHLQRGLLSHLDGERLWREIDQGILQGRSAFRAYQQADRLPAPLEPSKARRGTKHLEAPAADSTALGSFQLTKRLAVAFVSQGYPPDDTNGIARWTQVNAEAIAAQGHDVHVITRAEADTPPSTTYSHGIWLHRYREADSAPLDSSSIHLPRDVGLRTRAVRVEIERIQRIWGLDVVSGPIWDVEALSVAGIGRLPLVTTLHTTYAKMKDYKPEWAHNLRHMTYHVNPMIRAEQDLLSRSSLIVANSHASVTEMIRSYPRLKLPKVVVIPHGAARSRHNGNNTTRDPHELTMLYVGRIERRKGLDLLLDALLSAPPISSMRLVVAGAFVESDIEYAQKIREKLSALSETTNIVIDQRGHVSDSVLEDLYLASDIVVVPSRYESFGLVAIEAIRQGGAVLAANVGGLAEIFSDDIDGVYFDLDATPGDPRSLVSRLDLLMSDADKRAELRRASAELFERKYTDKQMADSFIAEIFALIEKSAPSCP